MYQLMLLFIIVCS